MKLDEALNKFDFVASELALRPSLITATEVYSGLLHQREVMNRIYNEDGAIPIEIGIKYSLNLNISRMLMRNLRNKCPKSNYLNTLISLMGDSFEELSFY